MTTALVVLLVGVLLCFYGIRSVNLALVAAGFALGFLVAEAFDADPWTQLWVGLGSGVLMWLVVSLVFRFATFVVGLATGAVVGAKLWAALSDPGTSTLLGIVLVVATAYVAALLAEKYARRALLWFTALGGASVILSGAAMLWDRGLGFLAHPDEGWQQTVMLVVWLAVAGSGWYVQRQIFRSRLGLPPKPDKPAPAAPAGPATPAAEPPASAT